MYATVHCYWAVAVQSSLSDAYLESLDRTFTGVYEAKYPVVGYMKYLMDEHQKQAKDDL